MPLPHNLFMFAALRAQHEFTGRGPGTLAAGKDLGHLRRDRQFDVNPPTECERRFGRFDAFSNHPHAGQDLLERPPTAKFDPDVAIARQRPGAREHQITQAA
jgi:hypothetical protein